MEKLKLTTRIESANKEKEKIMEPITIDFSGLENFGRYFYIIVPAVIALLTGSVMWRQINAAGKCFDGNTHEQIGNAHVAKAVISGVLTVALFITTLVHANLSYQNSLEASVNILEVKDQTFVSMNNIENVLNGVAIQESSEILRNHNYELIERVKERLSEYVVIYVAKDTHSHEIPVIAGN